jgi:hypothetical protein
MVARNPGRSAQDGPVIDDLLARALTAPVEVPVEHDWSFRADDPEGGFNRYGWGSADQILFDASWDEGATALAEGLISAYGAMWPWPMPRSALASQPDFAARIMDLAERRVIGQRHTYKGRPAAVFELALMYGSFDRIRVIRSWPPAPNLACPICGRPFSAGILSPWMLRQYGPPRFCNYCCVRARNGCTYPTGAEMIASLQALAEGIEGIPEQAISASITLAGMTDERRDQVMTGLIVAPVSTQAKSTLGPSWLAVLQAAGLVGDAWRPARGTYCLAADGHLCRSLAERTVDDFLNARGIAHFPEPAYPGSNSRADWSLPDGTFVEYAGLLSDADYRAKIAAKRTLAAEAGVPLIVLVPEDLTDLGRALRLT